MSTFDLASRMNEASSRICSAAESGTESAVAEQFITKLEQDLSTASEKAAASTRDLKSAQDASRAAVAASPSES